MVSKNPQEDCCHKAYLKTADELIVNLLSKQFGTVVVDTSPAPKILVAAVALGVLKNASCDCPHDHAENEPTNGKHGVVNTDLLRPVVTATAVTDKDSEADKERDTRASKDDLLRPGIGVVSPSRQTVHGGKRTSGIEDGERG
jgi:hypothetical protein